MKAVWAIAMQEFLQPPAASAMLSHHDGAEDLGKLVLRKEGYSPSIISKIKSGGYSVEEMIEGVLGLGKAIELAGFRLPVAFGSLLTALLSQLHCRWPRKAVNWPAIQLVLLRSHLLPPPSPILASLIQAPGNLVIIAASGKEIEWLSEEARDHFISWILEGFQAASDFVEASDWPIIFHHIIQIAIFHSSKSVRPHQIQRIFQVIWSSLAHDHLGAQALFCHLNFLFSQSGRLQKLWVRHCLRVQLSDDADERSRLVPLAWAGLFMISGEGLISEGSASLGLAKALRSRLSMQWEISEILGEKDQFLEFLEALARNLPLDFNENGLLGAFRVFFSHETFGIGGGSVMIDRFFLALFSTHLFARRGLLVKFANSGHRFTESFWVQLREVDSLALREGLSSDLSLLKIVADQGTEALRGLAIDHGLVVDYLNELSWSGEDAVKKSLAILDALDSPLLWTRMMLSDAPNDFHCKSSYFRGKVVRSFCNIKNWATMSETALIGEFIKVLDQTPPACSDLIIAKCVELCELLQTPLYQDPTRNSVVGALIQLALEFLCRSSEGAIWSVEDCQKLFMGFLNKLSSLSQRPFMPLSPKVVEFIFNNSPRGHLTSLKFAFDQVATEGSEIFYTRIAETQKCLEGSSTQESSVSLMKSIVAALQRVKGPLKGEVVDLMAWLGGRVVREPQWTKPLISLLEIHFNHDESVDFQSFPIGKFGDTTDLGLLSALITFLLSRKVPGALMELMKALTIHFGIVTDDSEDEDAKALKMATDNSSEGKESGDKVKDTASSNTTANPAQIKTKFKGVAMNEGAAHLSFSLILDHLSTSSLKSFSFRWKHRRALFTESPGALNSDLFRFIRKDFIGELGGALEMLCQALITCRPKEIQRFHRLLAAYYCQSNLILKELLVFSEQPVSLSVEMADALKLLVEMVGLRLNRRIYALLPLQQDKLQSLAKMEISLKKTNPKGKETSASPDASPRATTQLIYQMERFEAEYLAGRMKLSDFILKRLPNKLLRSTARDFKIRLDHL